MEEKPKRSLTTILKNIFFGLLIINFVPSVFYSLKDTFSSVAFPKAHVAYMKLGEINDSTFYAKKLRSCEKDSDIKALLIKVESPGGISGSGEALFNEIKKFKAKKPVIAFVENVCASAGYYAVCSADKIIANGASLVGSIGTLMQVPNVKGLADVCHVKVAYMHGGKFKVAGNPVRDLTDEEQQHLQDLTLQSYQLFVNDVARERKLDSNKASEWADGKVFTGSKALELGLIDQIGSYSDAVDEVKKMLGLGEDDEITFVPLKKKQNPVMEFLAGDQDFGSGMGSSSWSKKVGMFLSNVWSTFTGAQTRANMSLQS
ncbi:signal peptide peptidase SppA [Candidatus Babeliales bacterium]|nr:signal peptide peptidase SppA [Candidatus Babeliales bacterium]